MKRFKDIAASAFPNVDSHKFDEWKTTVRRAKRNTAILIVALVLLNIFLILMSGTLALGGMLLCLLLVLVWSKAGRLQKELGIDKAAIKRAKAMISTVGHMLALVSMPILTPLLFLFELSIWMAVFFEKRWLQQAADAAAADAGDEGLAGTSEP